jgi:hypothetical protein
MGQVDEVVRYCTNSGKTASVVSMSRAMVTPSRELSAMTFAPVGTARREERKSARR